VTIKQLTSPIPSEREFSCLALASLVLEDKKNLDTLLAQGGLRKLIQSLCDVEVSVRIAAAGALRNITIAGKKIQNSSTSVFRWRCHL
jgi:hypothetical protein